MNRENEGVLVALNEVKQWNGRNSRIKFYQGSLPTFAVIDVSRFFFSRPVHKSNPRRHHYC